MSEAKKIALVTGASRGIGKAIAQSLAQANYQVVGTATSPTGAQAIQEALSPFGQDHRGLVLNLSEKSQIDDFLQTFKSELGALPDVLVNNAGITRDNLAMRMKEEEWDDILATNLSAIFHLSKACLRTMMKKRWGRIVSIGSVVGSSGNPGQANYAAAKAGVIGFSKSLAMEVASRGITVNVVAPGFIATDMTDKLTDEQKSAITKNIPQERLGSPDDIAAAVEFLCSERASYVTGTTLHVNGGLYMN